MEIIRLPKTLRIEISDSFFFCKIFLGFPQPFEHRRSPLRQGSDCDGDGHDSAGSAYGPFLQVFIKSTARVERRLAPRRAAPGILLEAWRLRRLGRMVLGLLLYFS
ncbi:hypothetical protein V6Z11_D03G143700 [Gossypium hirsutum]